MTTILEEIAAYKRESEVPALLEKAPIEEYIRSTSSIPEPIDICSRLRHAKGIALIAEIKRASPSRGLLRADFNPALLAARYEAGGANAISVLTDKPYFQGSLEDFRQVRAACPNIPLLCKDFVVHPVQIHQARAAGADAILLITAILSDDDISNLYKLTRDLGMVALIEVHDQDELNRVLPLNPGLIGINNRDLHDFTVDIKTCLRLRSSVPSNIIVIAESGIHTKEDISLLQQEGINAALIGEAIVTSSDVESKIKDLLSTVRGDTSKILSQESTESLMEEIAL